MSAVVRQTWKNSKWSFQSSRGPAKNHICFSSPQECSKKLMVNPLLLLPDQSGGNCRKFHKKKSDCISEQKHADLRSLQRAYPDLLCQLPSYSLSEKCVLSFDPLLPASALVFKYSFLPCFYTTRFKRRRVVISQSVTRRRV